MCYAIFSSSVVIFAWIIVIFQFYRVLFEVLHHVLIIWVLNRHCSNCKMCQPRGNQVVVCVTFAWSS